MFRTMLGGWRKPQQGNNKGSPPVKKNVSHSPLAMLSKMDKRDLKLAFGESIHIFQGITCSVVTNHLYFCCVCVFSTTGLGGLMAFALWFALTPIRPHQRRKISMIVDHRGDEEMITLSLDRKDLGLDFEQDYPRYQVGNELFGQSPRHAWPFVRRALAQRHYFWFVFVTRIETIHVI
jgi:hypothetical protein